MILLWPVLYSPRHPRGPTGIFLPSTFGYTGMLSSDNLIYPTHCTLHPYVMVLPRPDEKIYCWHSKTVSMKPRDSLASPRPSSPMEWRRCPRLSSVLQGIMDPLPPRKFYSSLQFTWLWWQKTPYQGASMAQGNLGKYPPIYVRILPASHYIQGAHTHQLGRHRGTI